MALDPVVIFYSWQSDLPNSVGRGFISSALEKCKELLRVPVGADLKVKVAVDRDTKGKLGAPDIADTIFEKISKADVFVGDISIINALVKGKKPSKRRRLTPNPNVMTELGYAAGRLGWDRIVCVCNTAFGKVDDLPFDLRNRRILTYEVETSGSKAPVRKDLVSRLVEALQPLVDSAWKLHRPHPMRFAAYAEVSLVANRWIGLWGRIHANTRPGLDTCGMDDVLDLNNFSETLRWADSDGQVRYTSGNVRLAKEVNSSADEFRKGVERILTRFGERLDPEAYETLYRSAESSLVRMASWLLNAEAAQKGVGVSLPHILGAHIIPDEESLGQLRELKKWCEREHNELLCFDKEVRQVVGTVKREHSDQWRITRDKLGGKEPPVWKKVPSDNPKVTTWSLGAP